MTSVTKNLHLPTKKSVCALEQLSSAISGGASMLVRQPKAAVFQAEIDVRIYHTPFTKG